MRANVACLHLSSFSWRKSPNTSVKIRFKIKLHMKVILLKNASIQRQSLMQINSN